MIDGARVAALFHIDPLTVLDAPRGDWCIRLACAQVAHADEEERERRRLAALGVTVT